MNQLVAHPSVTCLRFACLLTASLISHGSAGAVKPLPDARVGESYEYCVALEGFVEPIHYRWSGNLPGGFYSSGPCLWSTNVQAGANLTLVVMDLTDAIGETNRCEYSLNIRPILRPVRIVTDLLPVFVLGDAVDFELAADGGEGVLRWEVLATNLPPGLRIELGAKNQTCRLTGRPTRTGDIRLQVAVSDARGHDGPRVLTSSVGPVIASPLEILTESLPPAFYHTPYAERLGVAGGKPPYRWSVRVQAPASNEWVSQSAASGIITGVPPRIESLRLALNVTDATGTTLTRSNVALRVEPPPAIDSFEIQAAGSVNAVVGQAFETAVAIPSHRGWVEYRTSGVPPWLRAETRNGVLRFAGQPGQPGNWSISVEARDLDQAPEGGVTPAVFATAPTRQFTIQAVEPKPAPAPVRVLTTQLPPALARVPYKVRLAAQGGEGSYGFQGDTSEAAWVSLDPAGELSGTPSGPGEWEVSVQAHDARGALSPPQTLAVKAVSGAVQPLQWLKFTPPVWLQNHQCSFQVPLAGGLLPYVISLESALPPGLGFDPTDGSFTGTPTMCGEFEVALSARDSSSGAPLPIRFNFRVIQERVVNYPAWPMVITASAALAVAVVASTFAIRYHKRLVGKSWRKAAGAS